MRTLKKSTALIISVCIVISALTCMLSATLPASANTGTVPQASYTYDFTDATKFTAGQSIVPNIPGAVLGDAIPTGGSVDATTFVVGNMDIYKDVAGTFGLGENSQFLKLGKLRTGNILSDKYADTKNYAEYVVLNHPNDKVITNPDGTKTLQQYPVKKISLDLWIPNTNATRGGVFMSKGTKVATYDATNDLFTTSMAYLVFGLTADETNGLKLCTQHGGYKKFQIKPNSAGGIESITIADFDRPTNGSTDYSSTSATTLGSFAVDADGNALSSDLVTVLNTYFAGKTTLTNEERWVHFENSANGTKYMQSYITFNFSDYATLREANPTLPEKLTLRLTNINNTTYVYNASETQGLFNTFGYITGNQAKMQGAAKSATIEYDISSYYAVAANEFKTSFLSSYNTLVADILKAENLTAINAQIAAYDALSDGVKSVLAEDSEVQTKLSTLKDAKEALEDGAYFFDAFEGELNWKVDAHITDLSKTINSVATDVSDNLTETNVYSDAAATAEGDNGKAFWGIHTDKDNEYNKALYLRKSFNQYNMNPQAAGDVQRWPSVLYVLKDGIIPANSEIEKITGKIYHSATHYKHATGILNYYEGENRWDVATITGATLQKVSKLSATNINYANGAPFLDAEGNKLNTVATTFKTGQWVDFSLTYIEEKGVYEFTVNGIATDGVSQATLTGYTEKVTADGGMVDRVGLFHGSQCRQTFDNIAVTLKQEEVVDIAPEVLGARILKQATDNNQNLRIDVDFTKAIADSEKIAEYGVILQAGTQTKDTLIDANNTTRTVLSYDPAVNAIPETMIVTVSRSAANDGKRVTAIAYVKDTEGNYHYSNNDETNSAGQNVVTGGLANKSVIGVMKSWYSDLSVNDAAKIATAIEGFAQDGELDANTVKEYIDGYIAGTYTTTSPEYATCKEYLRGVFYKYYSI
ncbi:MAG: hypothetical protein J6J39_05415 [Clostridia bacterium]|nr:hypothetical protein [Clostridia bacterium]